MTSAMTVAEAYTTWLGIAPQHHPPHHYALLGLPPQTRDEHAILQAYQQRAQLVGRHLDGPHAEVARRLLGELAAAQACLLNADARVAYDQWLSAALRHSATMSVAGNAARPVPRSKDSSPAATWTAAIAEPPLCDQPSDEDEPTTILPWLIGGACAGLLAVAVLAIVLFGVQPSPRVATNGASRSTSTSPIAQRKAPTHNHGRFAKTERGLGKPSARDDVLGQRVAPLTTKPEQLRPDDSLVGPPTATGSSLTTEVVASIAPNDRTSKPVTDDATRKPDGPTASPPAVAATVPSTASVLAKLPKSFDLPPRTSSTAGILAELPVTNSDDIALQLDATAIANGDRFALRAEAPGVAPGERVWPVTYTADGDDARTIGEYSLVDGELRFRWHDAAQPGDEALASAALAVLIDDQVASINQRSPEPTAPLKLAVNAGAISTSAKIASRPSAAKIYFALDRQEESFPTHQLTPSAPAASGHEIDMIFGEANDPYRLAMRVLLVENGSGGVRIEARPMIQAADAGPKWEYFRPHAVLQTLAQLKQQESLLDGQLAQLEQRVRGRAQREQAMDLYNRQATELQSRILALERLHTLCTELNDQGALHYRVFTKFGEREVDLLDSSVGVPVPAAGSVDRAPADAIVGPPTAATSIAPKIDDEEETD